MALPLVALWYLIKGLWILSVIAIKAIGVIFIGKGIVDQIEWYDEDIIADRTEKLILTGIVGSALAWFGLEEMSKNIRPKATTGEPRQNGRHNQSIDPEASGKRGKAVLGGVNKGKSRFGLGLLSGMTIRQLGKKWPKIRERIDMGKLKAAWKKNGNAPSDEKMDAILWGNDLEFWTGIASYTTKGKYQLGFLLALGTTAPGAILTGNWMTDSGQVMFTEDDQIDIEDLSMLALASATKTEISAIQKMAKEMVKNPTAGMIDIDAVIEGFDELSERDYGDIKQIVPDGKLEYGELIHIMKKALEGTDTSDDMIHTMAYYIFFGQGWFEQILSIMRADLGDVHWSNPDIEDVMDRGKDNPEAVARVTDMTRQASNIFGTPERWKQFVRLMNYWGNETMLFDGVRRTLRERYNKDV